MQYIDSGTNSSRGNLPFTEGHGATSREKKGKAWYPGDEYKGDVARMLMYMYLRYNLPFHHVSTDGVGLLLKWNAEDEVSPLELQRNNEIEQAQGVLLRICGSRVPLTPEIKPIPYPGGSYSYQKAYKDIRREMHP